MASAPPRVPDFAAGAAEVCSVRNPGTTSQVVPELHFVRTKLKTFQSYLSEVIHVYNDKKKTPVCSSVHGRPMNPPCVNCRAVDFFVTLRSVPFEAYVP